MRLFSRPRPSSRHMAFFRVREALEREGCALCRLSLEIVARYLDGLAYESANDPGIRDHLRASRGFCPHHAWQIARLNSGALDVAIIYRDVLGEVASILESDRSLPARLLPHEPCPACETLVGSAGRYLGTLLDHLREPDFAAVYRASEGLCQPHLDRALRHPNLGEHGAILRETALRSLRAVPDSPAEADMEGVRSLAAKLIGAFGGLTRREPLLIPTHPWGDPVEEPTTEQLISALKEQGCPICREVQDAEHDVLSRLGQRHQAEYSGVCNLHGWHLAGSARTKVALPVFHQMAHEAVGRMEAWPPTPRREDRGFPLNLLGLMRNGHARAIQSPYDQPCPVEAWNAHVEVGWARALAGKVALPDVQAAFRDSSGLCLPHLILALSCSDPTRGRLLTRMQAERVRDLVAELNEFVRKNNCRFRDEPWGREATSPRRAVGLMVGAEGLRGVGGIWWPDRRS